MSHILTNHRMPANHPPALCPACGRAALHLGGNQFQCRDCGRVGIEPVGLGTFLHTDAGGNFAITPDPIPGSHIRWACKAIPGCTHDTEDEANRHRQEIDR